MGSQEPDYITQRIGVFGRYQLRCFLLVQFVGVFAAWQVLSSSFMLPEVEFWCSPASLELEVGEMPEVSVSPVMLETNTTDHCLMFTQGTNTTTCSRWDFSRTVSPESV